MILTEVSVKCILSSTFMLPCIVTDFFLNKQTDALIIQIYSGIKLYIDLFHLPTLMHNYFIH